MRIVVGYADTAHGRAALEEARAQAQSRQLPLHVVAYVGHDSGDSPSQVRAQREAIDRLEQELKTVSARLAEGGVEVSSEVRHGLVDGVSQALVEAAERARAQLLVIGMRRRSPVGKLVLGSVVQDVLLSADCPVLAVKAPAATGSDRAK